MEIKLEKLNQSYKVLTDTGKELGSFQMECDGSYGYWRDETLWGFESAYTLRAIADKLDEVNKPLDDLQKVYFTNERKLFEDRAKENYKDTLSINVLNNQFTGVWEDDKEKWLSLWGEMEDLRRDYTPY